ncbi:lipocalin family protein [Emticicia sp. BO119]|uniref:lipocalin family protein n=1 Tax=Emticicia sp. BO119 TaxID=2757768 RepID=UPI0015F0D139|nr:lipocalin family protein [Emticicia sp. BO119]MBA4848932.1 lipocalin family protein [Emticicia sp. BO119]
MLRKIQFFIWATLLIACQDKKNINPAADITGKWRLISYCYPSGGLSSGCQPVIVPDSKGVYIEFSSKGAFNETYKNTIPADYAFMGCGSGSYEISDKNIRIRAMCMSSTEGKLVEISSLSNKKLILKPYTVGEYVFVKE